jgi:hypothetical protein
MDDIRGIAEWWLMRQQVRVDLEALARVLKDLATEGSLEKIDSANGVFYRLGRPASDRTG